jgi:hypothetical protein
MLVVRVRRVLWQRRLARLALDRPAYTRMEA